MPTLTHAQTLIIGAIVGPVLFVGSVFLTGARGRRILGALAGAGAYGFTTFGWDRIAATVGWWRYPFDPAAGGQVLAVDLLAGIVAGGAFGLVGSRLTARFGVRGLIGFLLGWSIWGAIHDLGGSALFAESNLMIFAGGPTPVVADVLNYASSGAVAQVAIRRVSGPTTAASFTSGRRRLRAPHSETR